MDLLKLVDSLIKSINTLIGGNLFILELYLEVPEGIEQCDINSRTPTGTSTQ